MKNLATGDIVKLGGFYLGGELQTLPTRPWQTKYTPTGTSGAGNVPTFPLGKTIEIRDTPTNDANKLRWVEVNYNSKKLLIADRVLLTSVSWDELNSQGLIFGKNVTIDGMLCKLRVLTGGNTHRGSGTYAGGSPTTNEWDRFVVNELNLSGLTKPSSTDLDSTLNATDLNSAHNKIWNWYYMYSWCQETYSVSGASRAVRGYSSARYWGNYTSSARYAYVGWRPVLEVLNSGPSITGPSENQGTKTGPFSIVYSCADADFDTLSVVEKVNGQTVGNLTGLSNLNDREIAIDLTTWNALALNASHTITVEATDAKGAKTTKTWTFTKLNNAPVSLNVEPLGTSTQYGIVSTLTPILVHRFQDADADDNQQAYQYVIENENGTVLHDTGKVMSTQSYYQVVADKLEWSEKYKYKVRVWDSKGVASDYTPYQYFMPNRNPTATNLAPGSASADEPAQSSVDQTFTWTFEDLDLETQQSYRLRVMDDTESEIYDSNRIYRAQQQHQLPDGTLEQNKKYIVELTVWDPNGLSYTTPYAYIQTNATPATPVISGPVDNYRTPEKPTFKALIGTDEENDLQQFKIQVAEDEEFTEGVIEFSSKEQRAGWKVDGLDIPEDGVNNSYAGKSVSYTTQVNLAQNKTYWWRICAMDATTGAQSKWSQSRKIRCGNKLQLETTNYIQTGTEAARRVLIAASYSIAADGDIPAELKVEVTNNAHDVSPTWEDATEKFKNTEHYEFVNQAKTAEQFAISVRITIEANDTLGEIYIDSLGVTFD